MDKRIKDSEQPKGVVKEHAENPGLADNPDRTDYLLECFRTTREELLMRVKHRDSWLKLQLLAQAVILALMSGIILSGVESHNAMPELAWLALPISIVSAGLYFTEDGIICRLSKYIGK